MPGCESQGPTRYNRFDSMRFRPLLTTLAILAAVPIYADQDVASGGVLKPEQAVYDVQSYDISIRIDPTTRSISGTTVMKAKATSPTNVILLDLDEAFAISTVTDGAGHPLKFERSPNAFRVFFPITVQPGDSIQTSVTYAGKPRIATNAPWNGGFVWSKTKEGSPWIAVALQGEGADLEFPVKDHPSDKAETAWMRLTVPDPLVAVGPGKLIDQKKNGDQTTTYVWKMSEPIPNYSLVFNAAPYKLVSDSAKSIAGTMIPIQFYVLPEDESKAASLIAETKKYLAFYEKYLGPFPFRAEKLGIVETPHLGMEHSTAIAYGNGFHYDKDGMDWLLLHEFGHEWWANLVTASDWKDFWIHEGFQSYMDTLYQEQLNGKAAYLKAMDARNRHIINVLPVAPRDAKIAYEVYNLPPDYKKDNPDIYDKGALVLHSLRYLLGDDAFFRSIRHMAYPTKESTTWTNGKQVHFATTDDFLTIADRESGKDLSWFFEVYLRQPKLPRLHVDIVGHTANLTWEVPENLPFPMPVDLVVDGMTRRVEMPGGKGSISFTGDPPIVDPDHWVLKAR